MGFFANILNYGLYEELKNYEGNDEGNDDRTVNRQENRNRLLRF